MYSLHDEVNRIAGDRTSGASAIFEAVLSVLESALDQGMAIPPLARGLVRAQPTMGPVWRAAIEALAATDEPGRFARFAQRARRAPAALTRVAVEMLGGDQPSSHIHLVTLSYSGAVVRAVAALRGRTSVHVSCAEGRPALEGRRLAADLAAAGIAVTCYSDAAIAGALGEASAVILGADAIAPDRFFNKAGTRMLAAAAAARGVPVYVLTTREKFVAGIVAGQLSIREESPDEIWPQPPAGVEVRNRYFETTSLDLVSGVITDAGAVGPADVPDVCAATLDDAARRALALLTDEARAEGGRAEG